MAVPVQERIKYCPQCKEKNIISPLKSLQFEEDRFWMFCSRENECFFLEEFMGKAVVTKEDLIIYGLPGELIEHMDIFSEDINKIVRLCMCEYIKVKYLENPAMNIDLETIKDTIRIFAESHDLNSFSAPTEVLQTDGSQITASEGRNGSHLPDFASVSQTSEIKALDVKGGESTVEHQEHLCNSNKVKKPRSLNPYDPVKKLADELVADLPILYQENVKAAFSKIEGYNFPLDFGHNTDLPLFKINFEEEERELARMSAEADKKQQEFLDEMGFNSLFS